MMSFNFLPVYLAFMNYINLPLQRAVLTAVLRCNFSTLFIFVGLVLTCMGLPAHKYTTFRRFVKDVKYSCNRTWDDYSGR